MVVDESKRGAVASADVLDVVRITLTTLGIPRLPHRLWRRKLGLHFRAETEQAETLVENDRTVDGCEIADEAAQLEHGLLESFEIRAGVGREVEPPHGSLRRGGGNGFEDLKK